MLWAFAGAAGSTIVFMFTLVLTILVGALSLAYAAYCFFVVLQDTAGGADEVVWPGEALGEWLMRAILMSWLVAVWLVPITVVVRASGMAGAEAALLTFVLLWICFPIGVLSSQGGISQWVVFRPRVLVGLLRVTPMTLGFYLLSGALLAGLSLAWYTTLTGSSSLVIPTGALSGAALLIYPRLLGRLARAMNRLQSPIPTAASVPPDALAPVPSPPPPEKPAPRPSAPKKMLAPRSTNVTSRPRSKREAEAESYLLAEDDAKPARPAYLDPEPEAYGLATDVPVETPRRPAHLDPEPEPYAVVAEQPSRLPLPPESPEVSALELQLAERNPMTVDPPAPLLTGVWSFPTYSRCRNPCLMLTLGSAALASLIRSLLANWPG